MIVTLLVNLIVGALGLLLAIFPDVTTLPTVFGYDIDGALVDGMGKFNTLSSNVWALQYVFYGFLAIISYYALKKVWNVFLGARSPTHN